MRPPLAFYRDVENYLKGRSLEHIDNAQPEIQVAMASVSIAKRKDQLESWLRTWPALYSQLPRLKKLDIWLDHKDKDPDWTFLNERLVVSYMAMTNETPSRPDVCVAVNLPNLMPPDEDPEKHFTSSSAPPPGNMTVCRRLRQRMFTSEFCPGFPFISEATGGFPVGLEVFYWLCENNSEYELEDWEREEREVYATGQDIHEYISDM